MPKYIVVYFDIITALSFRGVMSHTTHRRPIRW